MNEFSAKAEDRVPPAVSAPASRSAGTSVWKRPIIAGLPLPMLIVVALVLVGAGWYLFGPDSTPTVNQLAFREDHTEPQLIVQSGDGTTPQVQTSTDVGGGQFKEEVALMIGGVRSYAETNRKAIGRLSETVKAQSADMTLQQRQLAEAQAQLVLSARLSSLEARPAAQVSTQRAGKSAARVQSPLAGMRVEAVQNGMAWVYWQDKTWAVKAGDPVGNVIVTRIDAQSREVHTSAGTLREVSHGWWN